MGRPGRKYLGWEKASRERRKDKISDYNREYYNRNKRDRTEYFKKYRENMPQEQKEKWLKYKREYYRRTHWEFISKSDLIKENEAIKEEKEMLIKQNTLLQESNKKLKEDRDSWEKTATKFTNCIDTLEASIKNLEEENKKLKEELEQYKKWIPTIRIDKDWNVIDENGDRTYNSWVFHYAN